MKTRLEYMTNFLEPIMNVEECRVQKDIIDYNKGGILYCGVCCKPKTKMIDNEILGRKVFAIMCDCKKAV